MFLIKLRWLMKKNSWYLFANPFIFEWVWAAFGLFKLCWKRGTGRNCEQSAATIQNGARQRMRVSRYRAVVYLQLLFLLVDIFINAFGELFRTADVILLVLYM